MATTEVEPEERQPSRRLQVGMTLPGPVKAELLEAAAAVGRSAGEWVLIAAAEYGRELQDALADVEVRRRPRVDHATFTALELTPHERDELDALAGACGLDRSLLVTSVSRLALGEELAAVVAPLVESG